MANGGDQATRQGRDVSDVCDAAASGGVLMVTQLAHPKFTSLAFHDVVAWKEARKLYEYEMRLQCERQGKSFDAMCVPHCMGTWDLLDEYTLETVPEATLLKKINKLIYKAEGASTPDYKKAFKELHFDNGEKSVLNRVAQFIFHARKAMDAHALSGLRNNPKFKKKIFKAIVDKVTPKMFRDEVQLRLAYELGQEDDDEFNIWRLQKMLLKLAQEYKKGLDISAKKRAQETTRMTSPNARSVLSVKIEEVLKEADHEDDPGKSKKRQKAKRACWHCGDEKHTLRDCTKATSAQKKEAVKRNWIKPGKAPEKVDI
ncbi:hypothetical protein SPRG_01274 [Saprolegnia parasitica CBS 223.65]|uniref:CCHC-type domain-containing protein n=1 Tax=Saprolegnia parasitica (strain CBS 223.65) TaxID=695850 RepID=A0A067CXK1_SAPPC|nr:hypothetical protein SPRG_01274 [Saprolegnia parasitica CBS 223.65]KDO34000.1 hypothetical protein SPRG_01274 [Saprolegnia parasitica CBS 223.65]|eukprot:XP_012194886.1 hypothetical protein SPRG_01274 [Saprolegnia parasitica CBS 223.65]